MQVASKIEKVSRMAAQDAARNRVHRVGDDVVSNHGTRKVITGKNEEWAVVVGSSINALGVVRSLGSRGVRVALLSKEGSEPCAALSCYSKRHLTVDSYDRLVERLAECSPINGGRPVLFVTEEEAVRAVSEGREVLEGRYAIRLPAHERLMELMHKDGIQRLCELHGFSIPKALRIRNMDEAQSCGSLRYPCVLKPGWHDDEYSRRFNKAYILASAKEAVERCGEILPVLPDVIVQEWIDGGDDDIYFCMQYVGREYETVASFTGRKLRSWPPKVGGTASCIGAEDAAETLGERSARFFRAVEFQGMGSLEFKRDRRDGEYYVVEPTVARTDFQEEVATLHGINLPYAAYRYECGLSLPEMKQGAPVIWRVADSDEQSAAIQGAHPSFDSHRVIDALFRWDDSKPWLSQQWRRVARRARSLLS